MCEIEDTEVTLNANRRQTDREELRRDVFEMCLIYGRLGLTGTAAAVHLSAASAKGWVLSMMDPPRSPLKACSSFL
jgi:hypothetical protein